MTIIIAGIFVLVGIVLAIYFIGGEPSVPIKLRAILSVSSLALFLGLSAAVAFGYPQYKVWEQSKAGEAALAKATQDRQIKVQEAEQEAASKQAEANRILGESIRQYPESMEQKWVEAIEKTSNQVIYLPTEASVPITESARMAQKATAGK